MAVDFFWFKGLKLRNGGEVISFDPGTKKNTKSTNFFTHSHKDHVYSLNINAMNHLTFATKDILSFRDDINSERIKPLKYGKKMSLGEVEVIAHNAGHILGSAQFEVRTPNLILVYSGDINTRDMFTTKAADLIHCDVLVLETTFGRPDYVFPRLCETCVEIIDWSLACLREGKIPVFKVYSTGKAQEIIKIINKFTCINVLVSPAVAKVNRAYEKNGVSLDYLLLNSEEGRELIRSRQCILVISNKHARLSIPNLSSAIATGWAVKLRSSKDKGAFPLSGHADFKQLVEFVNEVKPKRVFTTHGFKEIFANYLSKKHGINARPLELINQKQIYTFLK